MRVLSHMGSVKARADIPGQMAATMMAIIRIICGMGRVS